MFFEIPQNLILMTVGAFLLGWLLSSISGSMSSRFKARKRDPRDDRIRSLEADHRVAQSQVESLTAKVAELEKDLEDANDGVEKRDNVISHQQEKINKMSSDLRDSVLKTRELRSELSERATENIRSEVKLREIETELDIAQASTDLIATGVLDYSLAPEVEESADGENDEVMLDASDMTKAAT
jgi:outer membrane murein-binding lipoprotein Lpp